MSPWQPPLLFCFIHLFICKHHLQTSGRMSVLSSFLPHVSHAVTIATTHPTITTLSPISSSRPVTRVQKFYVLCGRLIFKFFFPGLENCSFKNNSTEDHSRSGIDLAGATDGDFSGFYSTVVSWQHCDTMEARLSQIVCHGNRWLAAEEATVSRRGHIFSESRPRVC